jgi:hypothetical protein
MHPLMNVLLADAIRNDRLRQAEHYRRARQAARRSTPVPSLRARWSPGWSARQPSLHSD